MKRREFVSLLGSAMVLWSFAGEAKQSSKPYRIGFLGNSTPALEANLVGPFHNGLRDLGYIEGQNVVIEHRWAEGNYARFPALIADLVARNVDVIVTAGTPASVAVKKATTSIPLVMIAVGDPVGSGLAESLARPGGSVTGLTSMAPQLEGKRLELLREVIPTLYHFAAIWNPLNQYQVASEKAMRAAARMFGMHMQSLAVRNAGEIEDAFAAILREHPDALFVLADRLFLHHRARLMDFAAEHRLPGVHAYRELVEVGGLMSYGPSYSDMHRRAAIYVDKILHGAKPADLPIEQPTKFELVINLKTAKAMDLLLPPTLLSRVDEVIE